MKTYYVAVKWDKPYPKSMDGTFSGSGFHVAISKALRKWRKENSRQVIRRVVVDATLLQGSRVTE